MIRLFFLFAAAVLLGEPASATTLDETSFPFLFEKSLVNAIYSKGRKQIMAADVTPQCRQRALTALAAAAAEDTQMKCDTALEKVEDIGEILATIWESVGSLMDDVNMVVNSIPICMSDYSWINPLKFSCVFQKFMPIVQAVKHALNYQNFWMDPYRVMEEFSSCLTQKKAISTKNVNMILNNAKFCN